MTRYRKNSLRSKSKKRKSRRGIKRRVSLKSGRRRKSKIRVSFKSGRRKKKNSRYIKSQSGGMETAGNRRRTKKKTRPPVLAVPEGGFEGTSGWQASIGEESAEHATFTLRELGDTTRDLCMELAQAVEFEDEGFWIEDGGWEGLSSNFAQLLSEVEQAPGIRGRTALQDERSVDCSYHDSPGVDKEFFYKYLKHELKNASPEYLRNIIIKTFMREYLLNKYLGKETEKDNLLSQRLFTETGSVVTPRIINFGISLDENEATKTYMLKSIFKFQHADSVGRELGMSATQIDLASLSPDEYGEQKRKVIEIEENLITDLGCFHGDLLTGPGEGNSYIHFSHTSGITPSFFGTPITSGDDNESLEEIDINTGNIYILRDEAEAVGEASPAATPVVDPKPTMMLIDWGGGGHIPTLKKKGWLSVLLDGHSEEGGYIKKNGG